MEKFLIGNFSMVNRASVEKKEDNLVRNVFVMVDIGFYRVEDFWFEIIW